MTTLIPSRMESTILVLRAILSFLRIRKGMMVKIKSVAALNARDISACSEEHQQIHTTLSEGNIDHRSRSPADTSMTEIPLA